MSGILLVFVLIWSNGDYLTAMSPHAPFASEEECAFFAEEEMVLIDERFEKFGEPLARILSQCGTEEDLQGLKKLFPEEGEQT